MKTNLELIKKGAKVFFDMIPFESNKQFGFLCQHPYTSNTVVMVSKTKDNAKEIEQYLKAKNAILSNEGYELVNVTIPEGAILFRKQTFELIDEAKNLFEIIMLLNSTWYMTFIKLTYELISEQDLGKILKDCWTLEEYPNRDKSVNKKELIDFFKKADKSTLMDEEEIKTYNSLLSKPILTVYRGVGFKGKPNGLSWTTDIEKARWFANRYNPDNPQVYKMDIDTTKYKKAILAYFDSRNESEVIINTYKVKNYELIEGADLGGKDYSAKCVIPSTIDASQQ